MDPEQTINLREYLHILKRRRWIIVGTLFAVVAAAALISWRMTPIYEGVARVEVQPVSSTGSETAALLENLVDPSRRLQTQVELITSEAVLRKAADILDLPSTEELKRNLKVELVTDTQIIEVRVEHERPEEAQDWTNAVAEAYIEYRREGALEQAIAATADINKKIEEVRAQIQEQDRLLSDLGGAAAEAKAERDRLAARLAAIEDQLRSNQGSTQTAASDRSLIRQAEAIRIQMSELDRQIADFESGGEGPQTQQETLVARQNALEAQRLALSDADVLSRGGGTIVAPAELPGEPVRPRILRNILMAVILGLALGIGLGFLSETLDDRVRSGEEVEEIVGAPILGYVPHVPEWSHMPPPFLATLDDPSSGAGEAYRSLRTNLRFLQIERPLKILMFTSALAGEGKSTTVANLAVTLAQSDVRTVAMEGDLRKPGLFRLFDTVKPQGLLSALEGNGALTSSLQATRVDSLKVMASGGLPPNPTEILASSAFVSLVERVAMGSDQVLIDAPPVLGLADAGALANKVDGVILVVDPHITTRRNLKHSVDQIRKAGGEIVGAILNSVAPEEGYGYYYQYYYYQYSKDGRSQDSRDKIAAE